MRRQIVKNIFSNYAVSILGISVGFALVPFLIGKLGKESFGLISLVDSTIIFFEIATVGIRTALARNATYALGEDRQDEFLDYLGTGRVILFFSSAIVLVIGLAITYFFPVLFKVPTELALQSQLLFLFVCIAFTISIPNIVFWSVLYAKQRYDLINSATSFGTLTRAGALFFLFSALPKTYVNLTVYGLIYIFFTWAQNSMIVIACRKTFPEARWSLKNYNVKKVREILSLGIFTTIQRLGSLFVINATNILINIFYGPSANAIFTVSTKFPAMLRRLFTESTWSLTPTFTDLAAKKDFVRLEKLFFMYTRLLVLVSTPLSMVLVLFGKDIVVHWVGEEFALSGTLIILFASPLLLGIPVAVCGCINNAFGKLKTPAIVGLTYSFSNVLFGVILAKGFNLGLLGFGISNIISAFLFLSLFQPFHACKNAHISLSRYWTQCLIFPFLPTLFTSLAVAAALHFSSVARPLTFLSLAIFSALLVIISYILSFMVLNSEERHILGSVVTKVSRKVGLFK